MTRAKKSVTPPESTPQTHLEPKPGASQNGGARRAYGRLAVFVLWLLAAGMTVTALSRALPPPARKAFDRRERERVKRIQPDYVLIGNSILDTRMDAKTLNQLIAPERAAVLGIHGSMSAVWFLALKNQVFPVSKPRRVVVFFRNRELTRPRDRALGAFRERVERVALEDEPVLERKLAPPARQWVPYLGWQLDRLIPAARLHAKAAPMLDEWADRASAWLEPGLDEQGRRREINAVFSLNRLRPSPQAEGDSGEEDEPTLEEVVEDSFLPDILQLAANSRAKLSFVRVRTRAMAMGKPETQALKRYVRDLKGYLERHGAEYVDLSEAHWESLDMYADGDHIAARQRRTFTRLFVEHVGPSVFH